MKIGVVVFPGSNCDHDVYHVLGRVMGFDTVYLWHKDRDLAASDAIVLPGGFSYGDYLRCGSIARFSPIMQEVIRFANQGGPLIGICNGFQILTEAHLLPGVLRPNVSLKFICEDTYVRIDSNQTPFTRRISNGMVLKIPIAHMEGNYFIDQTGLEELESAGQVVCRYVDQAGEVLESANPNGSLHNIAGIRNKKGNVLGMMPHPERVCEDILGSQDGRALFESLLK